MTKQTDLGSRTYDFDTPIGRWNTASVKWDGMAEYFGTTEATPMWVADMDFKSPPEVIQALIDRAAHGVYGYTVRPDTFYEAIIDWQQQRHGFAIKREYISHSPGVVAGLGFIVEALTEPGDKVIIQPPVYHPFRHILEEQNREIVENPLRFNGEEYTIDFADLEQKAASGAKMLILCSPHNPVGRVWTRDELTQLGEICLRHHVLVIADEIHGDLVNAPHRHVPFGSLSDEFLQNSITCIAPSKTFNIAGLKTAMMVIADEGLRTRVDEVMAKHHVSEPNVFGVTALEAAYRHGGPWLDALLDYLAGNIQFMTDFLAEHAPEIRVIEPQGTYLVWLDCRALGLNADELDDFLLKQGRIAMNEGHIFGAGGEGFQRINIGCPRSQLAEGLETLAAAVKTLRQST